jgi:hypothetical protein
MKWPLVILAVVWFVALTRCHDPRVSNTSEPSNPGLIPGSIRPHWSADAQSRPNSAQATERREEDSDKAFLSLPPRERVQQWLKQRTFYSSSRNAIVAIGLDCVPYLVQVLRDRRRSWFEREEAMWVLIAMDRFVLRENFPLPEVGETIYVKSLGIRGRVNPFLPVNGRRIGPEGEAAVQWASEQTEEKDLRFYTREQLGLMEKELRDLPLEEQINRWATSVKRSRGMLGEVANPVEHTQYKILEFILVGEAPEALPKLVELLDTSRNPYLREEAIRVLETIDKRRVRLRTSELGRRAIASAERALEEGNLRPAYKTKEEREEQWRYLSGIFWRDEWPLNTTSPWALYALALETYYGEKTTFRPQTPFHLIEAAPTIREFITYLTSKDPEFPSWEYTQVGQAHPGDEMFHPRFRAKVDRLEEQWKLFQSRKMNSARSNDLSNYSAPKLK